MAKKRKVEKSGLEEQDRIVSQNFSTAANSISQLYASAQTQQRLIFQAGEQHGLEKLYQWILAREGEGSRVNEADVVAYLQNELDHGGDDASMPPTSHSHLASNTNTHTLVPTPTVAMPQGTEHTKMSVFPSTLPGPASGVLQPFQIGNNQTPIGNSLPPAFTQLYHPTHEPNLSDSSDSVMDMHTEDDPE